MSTSADGLGSTVEARRIGRPGEREERRKGVDRARRRAAEDDAPRVVPAGVGQRRPRRREGAIEIGGPDQHRDLLEARQSLVDLQNQLVNLQVSHFIARLRLWRDLGLLFIDSEGMWNL